MHRHREVNLAESLLVFLFSDFLVWREWEVVVTVEKERH
jgi:hypothetical protein